MSGTNFTDLVARSKKVKGDDQLYGYVPTEAICIIFLVLFGISAALHTCQAVYYKKWWLLYTTALCGVMEVVGWSARLWSSINPRLLSPYEMQLCLTIIAPTPLLAANFVILGRAIERLGSTYSRIQPAIYTIIFFSFDIVSLIVQAAGGGIAAKGAARTDSAMANKGSRIMLGGIGFQMFTITIFSATGLEFFIRYWSNKPFVNRKEGFSGRSDMDSKTRLLCIGVAFSTLCLFIRSVYRTIELAGGWTGRVIQTQVYFDVLDGMMIVLATYTVNILHPGWLLSEENLKKGCHHKPSGEFLVKAGPGQGTEPEDISMKTFV